MTFSHPEKITLNVRVEALLNYSNNMNNNKNDICKCGLEFGKHIPKNMACIEII